MFRAVVFDIGGVLEITPPTGWQRRWCTQLGLTDERFRTLLAPPGRAGSLGQMDVERELGRRSAGDHLRQQRVHPA
ncbi:hypothetical protein ACERMF_11605, partial [Egicoccus sp. AB-alg6-2]